MLRRAFCKTALAAGVAAAVERSIAMSAEEPSSGAVTDIVAITGSGREVSIGKADIKELSEGLEGELLLPADDRYESARRVWNGMIDKRPAMIAVCASASDVASVVTFTAERDLLLAVKGGGHSYPGKSVCDGGIMIDLAPMHQVVVDTERQRAYVGGGALLGHLDRASFAHGLATTTGIVSHTGVGGFTLGGGMGRTDRKFGLAVDNLLSAELVSADGRMRHLSDKENADLFWAIRGGGGNFGVVTQFEFQLHPFETTVIGGGIYYPFSQARDLLTFFAEYSADLPDEINVEPNAFVTEEGERIISVSVTYAGDPRKGEKVLAPLRAFGRPLEDTIGPSSYAAMQTQADEYYAHGTLNYLKSGYFSELTPAAITAIVESYDGDVLPDMWFQHLGGATARVDSAATAYFHREAHSNLGISGVWLDESESEKRIEAIRRIYAAIEPHMTGFYTNLNEASESRTWGNYGANYQRLAQIKSRYDSRNLFRLNANIQPAAES
jgi:FAD/FMN-containing dehydrogenase